LENFFTPLFFFPPENHVINKQKAAHTMVYHFPCFAFCLSDNAFCQGLGKRTGNLICHSVHIAKNARTAVN